MAWQDETALPFTPTGQIFFSPIIGSEVYVIDQEANFWKYNIATNQWTELASPTYGSTAASRDWMGLPSHFQRTLAISPDGTRLACISEGELHAFGAQYYQRAGGGRRIEIYTIASNSWSASKQTDFLISGQTAYTRTLVWQDNDTLWVWCIEGYSTHSYINEHLFYGKCVEYTVSTDTWTSYVAQFNILGRFKNYPYTWHGVPRGAAIKSDSSVVYLGGAYSDYAYIRYTVAPTDTYASFLVAGRLTTRFCDAYDKDKLWYLYDIVDCIHGYLDTADNSANDDQFPENVDRDTGYGRYCGISDDLVIIIAHARSAAPELMSFTSVVAPTVTTDPATEVT